MGWHPTTAAAVPALDPDGAATNVQAALDALALGGYTPAWQGFGQRDITTSEGLEEAWETSGPLGLTWSDLTGCEIDTALFPLYPAAWWHASAYARLTLWDGDPDDGGEQVTWPADALINLVIGEESAPFLAAPHGWAHNGDPVDGQNEQRVSASGLILAGRDLVVDGGEPIDAPCYVRGQVQGITTPDLVIRVQASIFGVQAAPAGPMGGIA